MSDETGKPNKPCPFCGGAVDPTGWMMKDEHGVITHGPECEHCGATAPNMLAWNTRIIELISTMNKLEQFAVDYGAAEPGWSTPMLEKKYQPAPPVAAERLNRVLHTAGDGHAYWVHGDGSHRGITMEDVYLINSIMEMMKKLDNGKGQ